MPHQIKFIPSGRGKARCPSDPDYPNGKAITSDFDGPVCKVELPYPAPECGVFHVVCDECGLSVMITAAGRPDDPISVELPCLGKTKA